MKTRKLTIAAAVAMLSIGSASAQVVPTTNGPPNFIPIAPDYLAVVSTSNLGGVCLPLSCVNPAQGIPLDYFATSASFDAGMSQLSLVLHKTALRSDQGVAMALASGGGVDLQPDEHFAMAFNMGTFRGQNGGSVGIAYRVADHISVNAGFVTSLNGGASGGRAGIRFGW